MAPAIRQASVSKIENQDDMRLSTLRKYIEALAGELEIAFTSPITTSASTPPSPPGPRHKGEASLDTRGR